jgi:hypothetical protein
MATLRRTFSPTSRSKAAVGLSGQSPSSLWPVTQSNDLRKSA